MGIDVRLDGCGYVGRRDVKMLRSHPFLSLSACGRSVGVYVLGFTFHVLYVSVVLSLIYCFH